MRDNGYSEGDIAEELQELMSGGVWALWLQLLSGAFGGLNAQQPKGLRGLKLWGFVLEFGLFLFEK